MGLLWQYIFFLLFFLTILFICFADTAEELASLVEEWNNVEKMKTFYFQPRKRALFVFDGGKSTKLDFFCLVFRDQVNIYMLLNQTTSVPSDL